MENKSPKYRQYLTFLGVLVALATVADQYNKYEKRFNDIDLLKDSKRYILNQINSPTQIIQVFQADKEKTVAKQIQHVNSRIIPKLAN